MDVAVVIPYQGGDADREANLAWVRRRFAARHPEWPVTVSRIPEGEPWCRTLAHSRAAAELDADVLVFCDADSWCDELPRAVEAVGSGYPWAVPHKRVHRLSPEATARVRGGESPGRDLPCVRRPYRGTAGGGVVVVPTATARDVPPDPRFTGWGGEDGAWREALRCLVGMEWRLTDAPLYHLWHPPAGRDGPRHGSDHNRALVARYHAARHDPHAMRALLAEARAAAPCTCTGGPRWAGAVPLEYDGDPECLRHGAALRAEGAA